MMIAKIDGGALNTESQNVLLRRKISGAFREMGVITEGGL